MNSEYVLAIIAVYLSMGFFVFASNWSMLVQEIENERISKGRKLLKYIGYLVGTLILWLPATLYLTLKRFLK